MSSNVLFASRLLPRDTMQSKTLTACVETGWHQRLPCQCRMQWIDVTAA